MSAWRPGRELTRTAAVAVVAMVATFASLTIAQERKTPSSRLVTAEQWSPNIVAAGKDLRTTRHDEHGRVASRITMESMQISPLRIGIFRFGPLRELVAAGVAFEIYRDVNDKDLAFRTGVERLTGVHSIAQLTIEGFALTLMSRDETLLCRIESGRALWWGSGNRPATLVLTDGVRVSAPAVGAFKTSAANVDLLTMQVMPEANGPSVSNLDAVNASALSTHCGLVEVSTLAGSH